MYQVRDKKGKFVSTRVKNLVKNLKVDKAEVSVSTDGNVSGGSVNWDDGRRLVELGVLAEALAMCAGEDCDNALDLRKTVSETRFGLGAILWVRCECGELNRVPIGKCHKNYVKGAPIYDVNSKAAEGMLHAGLSGTAVERFLSTLEVPPPNHKILKRREREIGPAIERVADETCEKAMALEGILTIKDNAEGPVEATASYDMGWQRRSSGRAYNSRSGHGVLVGEVSGKVLGYGSHTSFFIVSFVTSQIEYCFTCKSSAPYFGM